MVNVSLIKNGPTVGRSAYQQKRKGRRRLILKQFSNRNMGKKRVYRAIFPAKFQCVKQPSCMGGGSAIWSTLGTPNSFFTPNNRLVSPGSG